MLLHRRRGRAFYTVQYRGIDLEQFGSKVNVNSFQNIIFPYALVSCLQNYCIFYASDDGLSFEWFCYKLKVNHLNIYHIDSIRMTAHNICIYRGIGAKATDLTPLGQY